MALTFRTRQREADNVIILDLSGRIVLGDGGKQLSGKIAELLGEGHNKILLNLAEVTYIDSSGLGEMVGSYGRIAKSGGKLKLLNVPPRIADLLRTAPEGERLHEGALVVIAGKPNAGKSSLFNALLGTERAIVTEVPGTTRDAIEASAVIEGLPFRLVDTAGLRPTDDRIEQLGIEVSRKYLGAADIILYCEDVGEEGRGKGDGAARDEFLAQCVAPVVTVRTKADAAPFPLPPSPFPSVSALTGSGLDILKRKLAETAFGRLLATGEIEPIVTRARHRMALERAAGELDAFRDARAGGVDAVAAATHLRAAIGALEDLIGIVTPDDILDRVFAAFCIGK